MILMTASVQVLPVIAVIECIFDLLCVRERTKHAHCTVPSFHSSEKPNRRCADSGFSHCFQRPSSLFVSHTVSVVVGVHLQ